jgi:ubiquinone/menaquinone biosynthesis C-methylase UbiE
MSVEHARFWSTVARQYDPVVDAQIGPRTRGMLRDRLAREGALGDVVELGCGTGFFTAPLAAKARHVVATDVAPGMLALARERVPADNVTFQVEDCTRTSFAEAAFDTAFVSLVLHFTDPERTLAEMRRIVKPGGMLIVANLDPLGLGALDRVRAVVRIAFRGITGYRTRPPKGFGKHLVATARLHALLEAAGFDVVGSETIRDDARSSHIPVEYVIARRR